MPQLVLPVGLLYAQATTANIPMYDDTLTLLAGTLNAEDEFTVSAFKRAYLTINSATAVHHANTKKAMLLACATNKLQIVQFLVNQGFELNQTVVCRKSPLYTACEAGYLEVATYLI